MQADPAARQLAAILSADAVGYSCRMAEDAAATVAALRSRRETFSGYVREHHGRVVGTAGDNVLAEFRTAIDAVACAVTVQGELVRNEADVAESERLPFRIGVHLGEILVEDGEIFGDGINVAARLEGLAHPGGICISAAVAEQVRDKVEGAFEDIGDQVLKNIPAPVRVFRVLPPGVDAAAPPATTIPGFGGRPVIAILPFEGRGADAGNSYLADGIAEELIARLSAFRLVISRTSTEGYKGKRADIRQVSRELRARYIVVGSVQEAAGRVRVSVELVDGSSGTQLDAWESFQRGASLLFGLRTREELDEALALFRRAGARSLLLERSRAGGRLPCGAADVSLVGRRRAQRARHARSRRGRHCARGGRSVGTRRDGLLLVLCG